MFEEGTRRAQAAPRRVCGRPPLQPVESVTPRRTRPDRAGSSSRAPTHPDQFCTRSTFSPYCQHQYVRTDSVAPAGSAPAPDVRLWERIRCALRRSKACVLTSQEVASPGPALLRARRGWNSWAVCPNASREVATFAAILAGASASRGVGCAARRGDTLARGPRRRPGRAGRAERRRAEGRLFPRRRPSTPGRLLAAALRARREPLASLGSPIRELVPRRAVRALSRGRAGGRPPIRNSRTPRGAAPDAQPHTLAPGSAARPAPPAHDGTPRRNARPRRLRPATA